MCIWPHHKEVSLSAEGFHVSLDQYDAETVCLPKLECWRGIGGKNELKWVNLLYKSVIKKEKNGVISPKSVWGQSKVWGRSRGFGEGNFVILNLKANSCYYWPVLCFFCVSLSEGGSCPFELFRRCDNGWMLRTYVGRPLRLMEEELHAGPSVWENTRPLLSLLTPQLMNAWMAENCYRPFRGQSPQEFTLGQMRPTIENTFA